MSALISAALLATPAFAGTITVTVNGLVCAFCAKGIEKTFKEQAGVQDVAVDLDSKRVTITTLNNAVLNDDSITKLMTDAGFTVTNIQRND